MRSVMMTEGSIIKKIAVFAVPMLLSSLLQQFFSTADMYFIGNYIGRNGAAAVGASSMLITCMIGLFTGIATGIGITTAKLLGSGKIKELTKVAHTGFGISIVFGTLLMLVGMQFMKELLRMFRTPEDIYKEALLYARLYLIGIVPMVFFNVFASMLKAMGETKLPLYSLIIGGVVNLGMDYFLIVKFGYGIAGAAWATIFAQWGVAVILFIQFQSYCCKRFKDVSGQAAIYPLSFSGTYLKEMIGIGLPAGMQAVLLTFSNLIMQYYVNKLGTAEIAAFASYFKIETVIYLPILAMGQTVMIFVSQNRGAGNLQRIRKGILYSLGLTTCLTVSLTLVMLVLGKHIFWFMIKDREVAQCGLSIITITFPFYFLYGILEVTGCAIRGLGNTLIPMRNSMISLCGIRILLVMFWASRFQDIRKVAVVYPLTWLICSLLNSYDIWNKCKIMRRDDKNIK